MAQTLATVSIYAKDGQVIIEHPNVKLSFNLDNAKIIQNQVNWAIEAAEQQLGVKQ